MDAHETQRQLLELEHRAWQANVDGDADFYRGFLSADAVSVAPHGRHDAATIVAVIGANELPFAGYRISDPLLRTLGPDAALLTYEATAEFDGSVGLAPLRVYVTTVYRREGEAFRAVLHQHTPVAAR